MIIQHQQQTHFFVTGYERGVKLVRNAVTDNTESAVDRMLRLAPVCTAGFRVR